MNPVIATLRMPNGISAAFPTFPGQRLKVVGGLGEIRHEMHMPAVLQMGPDARVELDAGWADFLPKWVKLIGGDDKVTCTLTVNPVHVAEEVGQEPPTAPVEVAGEVGWPAVDLPDVVFGRHPHGHQCKACEAKRAKARVPVAA